MNVVTWIGILLSAAFFGVMQRVTEALSHLDGGQSYQFLVFLILAVMMAPVARFYRLPASGADTRIDTGVEES